VVEQILLSTLTGSQTGAMTDCK